MTGETGVGKTIAVQAFSLLLGLRSDAKLVGPHGKETYVEGEFSLPEGLLDEDEFETLRNLCPEEERTLVLARRVFADGRSRAYAWGRAIAREDMSAIGERLLSLSGQFESRRLAKPSYQMDLLDAFAGEEQTKCRGECVQAWKKLTAARRKHEEISNNRAGHEAMVEELRLLIETCADFKVGEDKTLRNESERLSHLSELAFAAQTAAESLFPEAINGEGAGDFIYRADASLSGLQIVDSELEAVKVLINEADASLKEATSRLRGYLESLNAEPGRLEWIEERLLSFQGACRRFKSHSYDELLKKREEALMEIEAEDTGEDPMHRAEEELFAAQKAYNQIASQLSTERSRAATSFSLAVEKELSQLNMGDGKLKVEITEHAPGPRGSDIVSFLIQPNPGMPFAPISQVASGGELSRIALSLRVASHVKSSEGTIVFDEIDAGVGGVTAHAVADSLRRMAAQAQLVVITHLPQIAAVADEHLAVNKLVGDPTQTEICELSEVEKKVEIERMLGGAEFLGRVG